MIENEQRRVMVMTFSQVIRNLEKLTDIPANEFFDAVENAFNNYSYEGEDELVGHEEWPDLGAEGSHELKLWLDHPEAYRLTLYVTCQNGEVSVTNVL